MKVLIVAVLALVAPSALGYDEKYDKLDVDKIIGDDALFTAYTDCMLDKGPCTVEHSEDFKKLLPEVIQTACAKCSGIQKTNVRKTVKALSDKKPDDFAKFRAKFDPKGEYEKDFSAFMLATD
uniref:Chemosensory protein 22 n=1 Tax=Helicoverpa assulta TaxID=52344 RepID=A0A1Z2R8P6_HELAU|nr:chemosensory protein 22 [Helicoverpa assulta]